MNAGMARSDRLGHAVRLGWAVLLIVLGLLVIVPTRAGATTASSYASDVPLHSARARAIGAAPRLVVAPRPGLDHERLRSAVAWEPSSVASVVAAEDANVADAVSTGARGAPVEFTQPGETFVRVGASPENLNFTFNTPGGVRGGTYAFPESTFNEIGPDPAALKNFGDLPGEPPSVFRSLAPPPGTPIQRGIVPGGEFGGAGGVPEVFFPEGF